MRSLVERLRIEREAQMDKSRASPLGSWSTKASEKQQRKYLSHAISSSIASERQAANASALPSALQLSGERALSLDGQSRVGGSRSAQLWRINLDVPVTHFWGKATLSAGFERSEAGSSRDAEAASAPLQQNARVSLRQDIQKGALSGTAQLALSGDDSRQDSLASQGERDSKATAEGSARLKLQLSPGLAITGSHQSQLERAATLQPIKAGPPEPSSAWQGASGSSGDVLGQLGEPQAARWDIERQGSRRSNSDLGLEWKWSKSLAISAGASAVRSGQEAPVAGASAGVWVPRWLRDESRANVSLLQRTGGGSWGLQWSRAWAQQDAASGVASEAAMQRSEDKRSDSVSLQAERKLFGWLSMRGSWKLAGETNYLASRLSDQATREAEARISGGLGSLALRYSDWSSQSSLAGADAPGSGKREYGVRYQAGRDEGVGLAVEYSVRDEKATSPASNWKLGVTYR